MPHTKSFIISGFPLKESRRPAGTPLSSVSVGVVFPLPDYLISIQMPKNIINLYASLKYL